MAPSENARRLKSIRARAIGLRPLARAIGWEASKYQYYEDHYKKTWLPRDFIERIKPHVVGLGHPPVTVAELDALAGCPSPSTTSLYNEAVGIARAIPERERETRAEIPVWASAEAGAEGAMLLTAEPIDWIRRSERMMGVRNPFAFYVIGESMSPAIEHGDQVVVHPVLPPQPGRDCVFLHEGEDGQMLALVKRLLKSNATSWRVRQFNPARDFDLPKKKWAKALMIAEKRIG
ncbi:MAG: S24 family peptidase [Enhydrobacter sp.]|nr:MAG: S24 family peptidase [Enhydrobacter sp.]